MITLRFGRLDWPALRDVLTLACQPKLIAYYGETGSAKIQEQLASLKGYD